MAATKAKKSASKLKVSKKKTLNKWIILGGVFVVAVIGVLIVRYSSAATYYPRARKTVSWTLNLAAGYANANVSLAANKGRTYRTCVHARSTGSSSKLYFTGLGSVTRTVTKDGVYCGNSYKNTLSSGALIYSAAVAKAGGANIVVTAVSIEEKLESL